MKFLNKPVLDIKQFIENVVNERQNGLNAAYFAGIKQQWIQRCEDYDKNEGNAVALVPWSFTEAQTTSFRNLYRSPDDKSVQKPHLDALNEKAMTVCPMCGEEGTPWTLDHYLPQQHFPYLSILPINLVPACNICQEKKGTKYRGLFGRLFLHPYYHGLMDHRTVTMHILPDYNAPTVELRVHPDVPSAFVSLVESHIQELAIHDRFKTWFRSRYISILRAAKRVRAKGKDIPTVFQDICDSKGDISINSWEYVLWSGVLLDPPLLQHLQHGTLPGNI